MVDTLRHYAPAVGRMLLSATFLSSSARKVVDWSGTAETMTEQGMVAVPLMLAGAIVLELGGGLLLLLGLKARLGAAMLLLFLLAATLIFHDFWQFEGQEAFVQHINFMKNLALAGGLLLVMGFGAGPLSFDARLAPEPPPA